MASNFPNEIDNIPSFLDVDENDGYLIKEFEKYIQQNDLINANNILKNIENADQKILSAERMNQLRDAIIALEKFYKDNIKEFLQLKQREWESIINRFSYIEIYSPNKRYLKNNMVLFNENGSDNLYIKTSNDNELGHPPNDTKYWRVLTIRGERGITLDGTTSFAFDWVSNQTYTTNTIVIHNNKWWIALKTNINSEPREGNNNWEEVMSSMQAIYPVQSATPSIQEVGELWFEVK